MEDLFKGIYTKFTSSTGASSLYANLTGGLYNTKAPQDTDYPYAVFYLISDVPHWTFDTTMENSLIQFTIYDSHSSVENICSLFEKLKTLYDWTSLTLSDNYPIYMKREFSDLSQSEDIWTYIVQYRTEIQAK